MKAKRRASSVAASDDIDSVLLTLLQSNKENEGHKEKGAVRRPPGKFPSPNRNHQRLSFVNSLNPSDYSEASQVQFSLAVDRNDYVIAGWKERKGSGSNNMCNM